MLLFSTAIALMRAVEGIICLIVMCNIYRKGRSYITSHLFADGDIHPVQTVAHLMKLSFDEGHRYAICQLGGINIIANLIEVILQNV